MFSYFMPNKASRNNTDEEVLVKTKINRSVYQF